MAKWFETDTLRHGKDQMVIQINTRKYQAALQFVDHLDVDC